MELFFLGTGAGMPSKQRNTSSLIVNLSAEQGGYWMFDCGEATQHQLLKTSIKPRKINKIFITHLHGDHIYGLPGFLGSRSFLGGEDELIIYGPVGIKEWIMTSLRLTKTHLTYPLKIEEIEEGVVYEDDQFRVSSLELEHVIQCFGFRIEQKPLPGKLLVDKAFSSGVPKGPLLKKLKDGEDVKLDDGSIVYSKDVTGNEQKGFTIAVLGDTKYCVAAVELAEGADILVHEATFDNETGELASEYGHSTISDAARTAKEANVKALIANHISARFLQADLAKLQEQGSMIFRNVHIAEDLSHFEWKNEQLIKK
jgi:ribonuclease Z